MRKYFITLILSFHSFLSYSQGKKIGDYMMNNTKFSIEYIEDREEFIIEVPSTDNYAKNTRLILNENQRFDFVTRLNKVKEKFIEWKNLSTENNITDIVKDFNTPQVDYNVIFEIGDESFLSTDCTSNFSYMVSNGISYLVFSNLSPMSDFENSYIKSKGYMMAFKTELEIKNFIFWLDPKLAKFQVQKEKEKINSFK